MLRILKRFSALVQSGYTHVTMKIQFASQIFREGKMYVAYSPKLDVSSCTTTKVKAQKNLLEAVRLFLEESEKKGSLNQILKEVEVATIKTGI